MSNILENRKILKAYDSVINEAKTGSRRKLQLLDDTIDDFMDYLKKEVDKVEDNPVYQRQMYQLLADTTKEHSEFLMALKRITASLDNGANVIPKNKGFAKPNNTQVGQDDEQPPEEEPKEQEQKQLHEASGPKLTPEQIKEVQGEMVKNGVPVRFMYNGQNLNIVTGELIKKGVNIMYQMVYWNFTKETSKKIANWLGAKAIFSN